MYLPPQRENCVRNLRPFGDIFFEGGVVIQQKSPQSRLD